MVLKDWKKTRRSEWYNKKKDTNIDIMKDPNNEYVIFIECFKGKGKVFQKTFKTKPQATKFAYNYMKKH